MVWKSSCGTTNLLSVSFGSCRVFLVRSGCYTCLSFKVHGADFVWSWLSWLTDVACAFQRVWFMAWVKHLRESRPQRWSKVYGIWCDMPWSRGKLGQFDSSELSSWNFKASLNGCFKPVSIGTFIGFILGNGWKWFHHVSPFDSFVVSLRRIGLGHN